MSQDRDGSSAQSLGNKPALIDPSFGPAPRKRARRAWRHRLDERQIDQLLRLRRERGGSLNYHLLAEGLPAGPTSLFDIAAWHLQMVRDYFSSGCAGSAALHRTASMLEHGFVVHSDCSGKLSPEFSLRLFGEAAKAVNLKLPQDWLLRWRACDTAPASQRFMMQCGDHAPVHIFSSLLGKLPP